MQSGGRLCTPRDSERFDGDGVPRRGGREPVESTTRPPGGVRVAASCAQGEVWDHVVDLGNEGDAQLLAPAPERDPARGGHESV